MLRIDLVAEGVIALLAYAYASLLPYRLSAMENRLLGTALVIEFLAITIAISFGLAHMKCGQGCRRYGFSAVALGMLTLILELIFATHVHSVSTAIP